MIFEEPTPVQVQITSTQVFSKNLSGLRGNLNMISMGSSSAIVLGSLGGESPLVSLFSDSVPSDSITNVDISGIFLLQITISGDPIDANII